MRERHGDVLVPTAASRDCWQRCMLLLAPFRVLLGLVLLALSTLVFAGLTASLLDRLLHSHCQIACGFAVDAFQIPNPFDAALVWLTKVTRLTHVLLLADAQCTELPTGFGRRQSRCVLAVRGLAVCAVPTRPLVLLD